MTLGDGIFWSTVLVLLAAALYQISTRSKWKTVGKAFGALVVLAAVIGGGTWAWYAYQNTPYVVEEVSGVRLGMSPIEVKLAKGAPTDEDSATKQDDGKFRMGWLFRTNDSSDESLMVIFYGADENNLEVSIVCQRGGYATLHGLGRFSTEKEIVEKLGPPTRESIHRDGLSKIVSFEQWKAAYEITKGSITELCVTETGTVTFTDEYQENQGPASPPSS